jgi:NAD(P)-dependent dehydrogenase (short-subunit alcohol dehydrogenase family)
VIAFTKALSREVCDTNIRVNCVVPGPIDTDLIRGLGETVVDEMINASPLKRLGSVTRLLQWFCGFAHWPARSTQGQSSICLVVARDIELGSNRSLRTPA